MTLHRVPEFPRQPGKGSTHQDVGGDHLGIITHGFHEKHLGKKARKAHFRVKTAPRSHSGPRGSDCIFNTQLKHYLESIFLGKS